LLELALTEYRQLNELIAQAEMRLDELGKQSADVKLLETATALGPRTAEAMAAYLHDAARFKMGKQVSACGGMVPRTSAGPLHGLSQLGLFSRPEKSCEAAR
jgi:transposase